MAIYPHVRVFQLFAQQSVRQWGRIIMGVATTGKQARDVKRTDGSNRTNGRGKSANRQKSDYLDPKQLIAVLEAVRRGDFSKRLSVGQTGDTAIIYDALNDIIDKNERLTSELNRISEVVGKEGQINERAAVQDASG